jgi:adenylate cyclase
LERLAEIFEWIGAHEAVLSGIAAAFVSVGVLFTPVGRGLRALLRRGRAARAAAAPPGAPAEARRAAPAAAPPATVPPPVTDRPSIAVLPFANSSGDPAHDYLADGLTEEIIFGLSRVKQLFVIARNTSFTYKGAPADSQRVSRELGVRYVLEGSVRRHGDRIRVTAQLVDAATRETTWAERFDRPLAEIVDLDDEVTDAIVAALQPALRHAEAARAHRANPEDLTAWALVNRAWYAVQTDLGSAEAAREAVSAAEEALRRDPDYAFAHAVLAHARSLLAREGEGPVESADAAMRRALSLDADDPLIHCCHGAVSGNLGRTEEGARAWERALALDPNNAAARAGLGIAQIYLRRPEAALANIAAAERRSPRDPLAYHWMANRALANAALGRWDEALAAAEEAVARNGSQVGYAVLAAARARAGRAEAARDAYAELERRVPGLDPDSFPALAAAVTPDAEHARDLADALLRAAERAPAAS